MGKVKCWKYSQIVINVDVDIDAITQHNVKSWKYSHIVNNHNVNINAAT